MIRWIVGVAMVLAMVPTAHAEFRFIGKDSRPEKAANRVPLRGSVVSGCPVGLHWEGVPAKGTAVNRAAGTDMALSKALSGIVPRDWTVSFANPALGARKATFRHTGTWDVGVDSLLRSTGLCGKADGGAKRLVVSEVEAGQAVAGSAHVQAFSDPYDTELVAAADGAVGAATPGSALSGGYEVRAGDTVRETLRRWGDLAGWQVVWDASRDFTIEVSHRFDINADFPEAARVLLDSYWAQGKPVKASIYANRVLRVVDAN